jgi:hypothetical protein
MVTKYIKPITIILNSILFICGCSNEYFTDNKFSLMSKYSSNNLANKKWVLTTNGFYTIKVNINANKPSYKNFILFPDGICVFDFYPYDSAMTRNYLNKVAYKSIKIKYGLWGVYEFKNDTLEMRLKLPPSRMARYNVKYVFKLNKESGNLELIDVRNSIDNQNTSQTSAIKYWEDAIFCSIDSLPTSNCWLKQKRWFWADKKEYKAYKKELRHKKNRLRK